MNGSILMLSCSTKYATTLVHINDGKAANTFPEDLQHYVDAIIRHWWFQCKATSADNYKEFVVCYVDAKIASWYVPAETGIPAVLILTVSLHHKHMYLDWLKVVA